MNLLSKYIVCYVKTVNFIKKITNIHKIELFLQDVIFKIKMSGSNTSERDVALAAVTLDGYELQYVKDEFKADPDIVLAAVQHEGRALYYAASELKGDLEIVRAAVKQDWEALEYATPELKADRGFMLDVVKQSPRALEYATDVLKNDIEILQTVLITEGYAL